MSQIWCLLIDHGKRPIGASFEVPIEANIAALKKAVKAEAPIALQNVDSNQLEVWRCKDRSTLHVSSRELYAKVEELFDGHQVEELQPWENLSGLKLSDTETLLVGVPKTAKRRPFIPDEDSEDDVEAANCSKVATDDAPAKKQKLDPEDSQHPVHIPMIRTLSPPTTLETIEARIEDFRQQLRPKVKEFFAKPRFHTWQPSKDVERDICGFYKDLAIPSIKDRPNMLLHNLRHPCSPHLNKLFLSGNHRVLCNTSGSGKTRLLFEGLCTHWGFYFVAVRDTRGIGAQDLELMIGRMRTTPGWVDDIFMHMSPQEAIKRNEEIASNHILKVLLARWIIFQTFIEVARDVNGGTLCDSVKFDWLLFQILTLVVVNDGHPFVDFILTCLKGAPTPVLKSLLDDMGPNRVLGTAITKEGFFYVIDEAQTAGRAYVSAFADESIQVPRPVLHPIIRAFTDHSSLSDKTQVLVSGTGFSLDLFRDILASGVGKEVGQWPVVHETGDFTDRDTQEAYLRRYLPPSFLHTSPGISLLSRTFEWLRGRHRFTARFIEELIISEWKGDRPLSPHKLLNAYVHAYTRFTLTDDAATWAIEPEVKPLNVQGFEWAKLDQVPQLKNELSKSLYTFILRGQCPFVNSERKELVEYGIARFIDDGSKVAVEEPLSLMSILRHFEGMGLTPDDIVRKTIQDNQGLGLEEAVLLSCTRLFRQGARLDHVFQFYGDVPEWAKQSASIVTQTGDNNFAVFDFHSAEPVSPSASIAFHAKTPKDVANWVRSMDKGWCIPSTMMGPDLMSWMRLDDGRLLLLVVQIKCHLSGDKSTLHSNVTAEAIQSLIPRSFFSSLKSDSSKQEIKKMLESINRGSACFTGAQYNILRLVVAYPLAVDMQSTRSSVLQAAIYEDDHPLALMAHGQLLNGLIKCSNAHLVLSSLSTHLKHLRDIS